MSSARARNRAAVASDKKENAKNAAVPSQAPSSANLTVKSSTDLNVVERYTTHFLGVHFADNLA